MSEKLKGTVFSGLKWSTVGTVGQSLFQVLQISILTRFLSAEDFGLVAMVLFIINFSNIFVDLGFTSVILYKQDIPDKVYSSIYWMNLSVAVLLYVALFALSPFVAEFYNQVELQEITSILGLNLIFSAIGRLHKTIMQKEFRFRQMNLIELGSFFIGLLCALTLALLDFGIYSLIYSTLTTSLLSSVMFLIFNTKKHRISLYFSLSKIKPFFKMGGYMTGAQVVSFFSTDIDILVIGKVLGPTKLGLYSLAKQLVVKVYSILNPIVGKVISPVFCKIQNDNEVLKRYYLKSISYLTLLCTPIYLLVAISSEELLYFLYGKEYVSGALIMSLLSVTYCVRSVNNLTGSLQIATGRTDLGLVWSLICVLIFPVVIYFSSLLGLNEVVLSLLILSILLVLPQWYIQIWPMVHIRLGEFLEQIYKPLFLLLLITGLYIWAASLYELPFVSIVNFIIKGVIVTGLYIGIILVIDKEKVYDLFQLFANKSKRSK